MTAEPPPEPSERLTLENVTVRFGGLVAIDDVSVSVGSGEIVGLIGPNGAGKTTLFNVACGIVKPRSGSVQVMGLRSPRPEQLAGAGVSRTLQGLGLFAGMTVRQNVMTGLIHTAPRAVSGLVGGPRSGRFLRNSAERTAAILERLEVTEYADRMPGELAYPDRKRVALARALVGEPQLLLLDEPAGGLSQGDIDDLEELVKDVVASTGCSVLIVEHHVDLVMSLCDRIVVLDSGRFLASGTPAEVTADQGVVDAYLGVDPIGAREAS